MLSGLFNNLGNLTFPLPQASTMAPKIDDLYYFIWYASIVMLVPTIAAMLYFAIRYRASVNKEPVPYIHGNTIFEWSVSIILSIVFVFIFVWGLVGFKEIYSPPVGAYEINVIGQQWSWQYQYANGALTTDLYVPRGQPVKLIMTSRDVIHDFFIPNFRLKQDVVPGMYTSIWFEATQTGEHDVFCAQYCGTAHSNMISKVIVLEPEQFQIWLKGGNPEKFNLTDLGGHLFKKRNCVACHSIDGHDTKVGPTIKGLFGKRVTFANGATAAADENYLRDSILDPASMIVKGFRPIMPTFKGLLNENEINALVAYMKSLKE